MKNIKILVLGDSLTFGRPNHNIYFNDTWPYLLQNDGVLVVHRGAGGASSKEVLNEVITLSNYWGSDGNKLPFNLIVIQVGIVDVTPRVLPKRIHSILNRVPILNQGINYLSKNKNYLLKYGLPWVNEKNYKINLVKIINESKKLSDKIIFIEIINPGLNLRNKCGDYSKNCTDYNKVIKTLTTNSININCLNSDQYLLDDGHHLNKYGHLKIYQSITHKLLKLKIE